MHIQWEDQILCHHYAFQVPPQAPHLQHSLFLSHMAEHISR